MRMYLSACSRLTASNLRKHMTSANSAVSHPAQDTAATVLSVDFETCPSRYRHWKLVVDGTVARLSMNVGRTGFSFVRTPYESGVHAVSIIDYSQKIPNNVDLSSDRTLQRALELWQPNFLSWWGDMGPEGSHQHDVYLRTAVSAEPSGWAHFDYVKMPDYRWGIFLAPQEVDRKIHFGEHLGKPVWQEVPGEYRANLRRIIVTQGDTEPASVEQQRHLGQTAPSLYDLRNLFQI